MEQELRRMFEMKETEMTVPPTLAPELRNRIGRQRMVMGGLVAAAALALVVGGFAGARSLTSDEALPPAERDSNVNPFVDTWTSTDVDGSTQTMVIRASGEDAYEITVHDDFASISYRRNVNGKWVPTVKDVCSGSPATMTGTGELNGSTRLVIPFPEVTCDDGSEPEGVDGLPPLEQELAGLAFEHDPESDILTDSAGGGMGLALVWGRAEAENRIGDVGGWITYGNKGGIWALDLTSPGDPADGVRLSSTPGTPIAWSPDGSKLLVGRDSGGLSVLNSDGAETQLTDANADTGGGSFSPDGTAVVYAVTPECWWSGSGCETEDGPAIYVVDAEGGSPQLLLAAGSRRYPDNCGTHPCMRGRFETTLQEPKWSPDGSQIAYFDGMVDWGNSLRVMDSDGTDSRVVVENSQTLGAGHVDGLQWSPDGRQLAFSIEESLYVVGVDGSGLRLVTDNGVEPYWSPDGSHIAYTRSVEERGSLEIVRLDDLQVQNVGIGKSGPWTAEVGWSANSP